MMSRDKMCIGKMKALNQEEDSKSQCVKEVDSIQRPDRRGAEVSRKQKSKFCRDRKRVVSTTKQQLEFSLTKTFIPLSKRH